MIHETGRQAARRVRLFIRDFRVVEAAIGLPEGQALTQFFASRKHYVNLRDARWDGAAEAVDHAVLKIDQVLWAVPLDRDVAISSAASTGEPRPVEVNVDGGFTLRGGLHSGEGQRLSDYLESQPQFITLRNAQLLKSGRRRKEVNVELGDVVLNQAGILAVWEIA